jgi:ribA/ribD-fused uncharacterized protein
MKYCYPDANLVSLEFAEVIRKQSTPFKAKLLTKDYIPKQYPWQLKLISIRDQYRSKGAQQDPTWNERKIVVMYDILMAKFGQHQQCQTILKSTGNAKLVELSDYDKFWAQDKLGQGENHLGKLLEQIRDNVQ